MSRLWVCRNLLTVTERRWLEPIWSIRETKRVLNVCVYYITFTSCTEIAILWSLAVMPLVGSIYSWLVKESFCGLMYALSHWTWSKNVFAVEWTSQSQSCKVYHIKSLDQNQLSHHNQWICQGKVSFWDDLISSCFSWCHSSCQRTLNNIYYHLFVTIGNILMKRAHHLLEVYL